MLLFGAMITFKKNNMKKQPYEGIIVEHIYEDTLEGRVYKDSITEYLCTVMAYDEDGAKLAVIEEYSDIGPIKPDIHEVIVRPFIDRPVWSYGIGVPSSYMEAPQPHPNNPDYPTFPDWKVTCS